MPKTKFNVRTYEIEKSRTGSRGVWDHWKYSAREIGKTTSVGDAGIRPPGAHEVYSSLDALASKMAELPEIGVAEFVPGTIATKGPRVSICDTSLTQWAPATDEEIAHLASLVQRAYYISKR